MMPTITITSFGIALDTSPTHDTRPGEATISMHMI
jgi:hypothetical protein